MVERENIIVALNNALKVAQKALAEKQEALEMVIKACGVKHYFEIDDFKILKEASALDDQIDLLDDLVSRIKRSLDDFKEYWGA